MLGTPKGAATVSLVANASLVGLKLGAGLAIGSIAVLSDALDSGMDLVGAMVAFFAIRMAARPADRQHPYGHGKIESVSAMAEGAFVLLAALYVAYVATDRLREGAELETVGLGIAAMAVSLAVNMGISFYLVRVARRTGSPALEATAWHRASDILTSLGVLIGLVLIQLTPWDFLDPVVALAIAAFLVFTAFRIIGRSLGDLLDKSLPEAEEAILRGVLAGRTGEFVGYHSLRTRRSGTNREIDFSLIMPRTATVGAAHELTDLLETEIRKRLPNSLTTIHVEPCDVPRTVCSQECVSGSLPHCQRGSYRASRMSMRPNTS